MLNSKNDTEYDTGAKIEDDYFLIREIPKRFFSITSLKGFIADFDPIILDEAGETYKDKAIGTANLVRFVGRKRQR